jgi:hypothetical protein
MNWMSWKTWTTAGVIIVVAFAIYAFAASQPLLQRGPEAELTARSSDSPRTAVRTPGVDPIHFEWLEKQSGSFSSNRNLFDYPAPPPPKPPPPPPLPPDKDKDGVPDFQDNCPDTANADQTDLDRDGMGGACDPGEVAPPPQPPPPPTPPPFSYKFIGTFGTANNPIATFTRGPDIVNARVGDIIENKFILRSVGMESVEIGFVGFPRERTQRIPLGQ